MSPTDLLVRLAAPLDLDAVVAIRQAAILALAPEHIPVEEATAWAHRPDRPERCRASIEAQRLWLALQNGAPVGWLEVTDDFVDGLYVLPASWRLGIGSRLMDMAESMIRDRGLTAARLNAGRTAVTFYQKRCYEASGPREPGRGTPMRKALR